MSVVRQQALTVVAPVMLGHEAELDAWLRESKRELQRALSRSSTTHFARRVLLPYTFMVVATLLCRISFC